MSFTKYKTVYKTRKEHRCFDCGISIPQGSSCTYGVTTDVDCVRYGEKITTGHFCTVCRPLYMNGQNGKIKNCELT